MPYVLPLLLHRYLLRDWDIFVAWLFNMAYSLILVFISTWTVVMYAPEAAGAGVAEVMAYLNGCMLPKVSFRTCPTPHTPPTPHTFPCICHALSKLARSTCAAPEHGSGIYHRSP